MKQVTRILCLALALPGSLHGADALYELFQEPSSEYRPFVRWWWNGARVTTEEGMRQLDVLADAGFGGVEINTIAMPESADPATWSHAPELTWLAEDWCRTVEAVAQAADGLDLTADIIIGSGWPFGGEFLKPSDQIKRLRIVKKTITGPFSGEIDLTEMALGGEEREDHEAASATEPSEREYRFLRLIDDAVAPERNRLGKELISSAKAGKVALELPKGDYTLALGVLETGYTTVKSGAPGARGPVLDHFNAHSVEQYLELMSDRMKRFVGPDWSQLFRATFVDSLELDHSNWSEDFEAEFEKRRGYAVAPYLPFILDSDRQDDVSRRARYDFCKTLIELFDERFIQTYVAWCERHGLGSRIQAYGRETHPLHGSMRPTHPEGESWLWHDERDRPRIFVDSTAVNKYVSSAAHLSGKRTVSFEAMTNAVPVFREALVDFKRTLDLTLMDGPNHPIIHGFNYTPLEAGFPGWVRFGCYLNERNPFWPYISRFNDYAARLGVAMRNSEYQATLAVLAPRAEEWERAGLLYQPFPEVIYPWYQYRLPAALQKLGFGVDFVSDELIAGAAVEGDSLVVNGRAYQALILEDVEALSLSAAKTLQKLAESQGRIAFLGSVPHRESGLEPGWKQRSRAVKRALDRIRSLDRVVAQPSPVEPDHHPDASEPGKRGMPFDDTALIGYLEDLTASLRIAPDAPILEPSPWLSLVRHRSDDQREFVLATNSSSSETLTFALDTSNLPPVVELWNPESGQRFRLDREATEQVELPLPPLHSRLLVFQSNASDAPAYEERSLDPDRTFNFSRDWKLTLKQVNNSGVFERRFERLHDISLSDDEALRRFSGNIVYEKTIELPEAIGRAELSLGQVNGTSHLFIDGQEVGARWYGDHNYTIEGLSAGEHELKIEVTTTLGNYVKSLEDNEAARRWAFWFRPIETGIVGPVLLEVEGCSR